MQSVCFRWLRAVDSVRRSVYLWIASPASTLQVTSGCHDMHAVISCLINVRSKVDAMIFFHNLEGFVKLVRAHVGLNPVAFGLIGLD